MNTYPEPKEEIKKVTHTLVDKSSGQNNYCPGYRLSCKPADMNDRRELQQIELAIRNKLIPISKAVLPPTEGYTTRNKIEML